MCLGTQHFLFGSSISYQEQVARLMGGQTEAQERKKHVQRDGIRKWPSRPLSHGTMREGMRVCSSCHTEKIRASFPSPNNKQGLAAGSRGWLSPTSSPCTWHNELYSAPNAKSQQLAAAGPLADFTLGYWPRLL